jgi:hypothetical protein
MDQPRRHSGRGPLGVAVPDASQDAPDPTDFGGKTPWMNPQPTRIKHAATDRPQAGLTLGLQPQQMRAFVSHAREQLFGGAAGGGKAICVKEPIPTPYGWTTMGELFPGAEIFTEHGLVCRVLVAHPVSTPDSYRLRFDEGTTMEVSGEHLWLTFDAAELAALTRRDPAWRAMRRAKRASRGKAKRNLSPAFYVSQAAKSKPQPAPGGTVRTTAEIAATLRTKSGRVNHAIPVTEALELPEIELPIDPYCLGAWLGDGSKHSGMMAGIDPEIIDQFKLAHYRVRHDPKRKECHQIYGLVTELRALGVWGDKHIPQHYLRASASQRLALLQGLMDTDGTVCDGGSVEFTNTNRRLAEGTLELIHSMGWKAQMMEGRARLNGKDCGPKFDIKWTPSDHVFRLPRKRDKQRLATRRTTRFRYIAACDPIPPKPMRCITVDNPTGLFLAGRQMIPTHNSHLMRVASILWSQRIPGLQTYLFRRLYTDLVRNHMQGETSFPALLAPLVDSGHAEIVMGEIRFWNGSRIYLSHCMNSKSLLKYQGAEIQLLLFDELTHFCMHPDTDVMTKTGWKAIADVQPGELVASIDATYEMTWQPVARSWGFPYDGELVHIDQRNGLAMAVTPNHKVVLDAQKENRWEFRRADQLPKFANLVFGGRFKGGPAGPVKFSKPFGRGFGPNQNSAKEIGADDWFDLLGWYCSEGSAFGGMKSPRVSIRQIKANAALAALMARLPWRARFTPGEGYLIFSRQLYEVLKPLGNLYQKRVPPSVFDGSVAQIERFLAAFTAGDGHVGKHRQRQPGGISIGLANELMRDDLARLFIMAGYKVTCSFSPNAGVGSWRLHASSRSRYSVQCKPSQVTRRPFKGTVYCLTVEPHHNFVARYGGRAFVTGNTEDMYRFLRGRCRLGKLRVPDRYKGLFPRILSGANPGGIGHVWVKHTFVKPRARRLDYIIWKPKSVKDGSWPRQFIPSRLEDNKILQRNDPGYADVLESIGDPLLVRAMREGDWDVVAGSMFGDVWSVRRHVCQPFPIPWDWELWRGADDGYGDPAACYWFAQNPRTTTIYVIRELYAAGMLPAMFAERVKRGDGELELITTQGEIVLNNTILKGMLDSAAFAKTGVEHIIGQAAVSRGDQMNAMGCRWIPVEKGPDSRKHRAQNLHRLLAPNPKEPMPPLGSPFGQRPGIVFFDTCVNAIETIPGLQRDPKRIEVVAESKYDHCFAAGTMVATARGQVPIEQVRVGDLVMTRLGYYRVARIGCRRAQAVVTRFGITATPEHKFWTDQGWTAFALLTPSAIVCKWPMLKSGFTMELNIDATRIRQGDRTGYTMRLPGAASDCTSCFMKNGMGRFPLVTMSTIGTKTPGMIRTTITNALRRLSTPEGIYREGSPSFDRISNWRKSPRQLGTLPKQATLGTRPTANPWRQTFPPSLAFASNAGRNSPPGSQPGQFFAAINVLRKIGESLARMMRRGLAQFVPWPSERTVTAEANVAAAGAEPPSGIADVYNLTVDGPPEFFANGVLVANCYDAVTYGLQYRKPGALRAKVTGT